VTDQVNVDVPPRFTLAGFAVIVTTGQTVPVQPPTPLLIPPPGSALGSLMLWGVKLDDPFDWLKLCFFWNDLLFASTVKAAIDTIVRQIAPMLKSVIILVDFELEKIFKKSKREGLLGRL